MLQVARYAHKELTQYRDRVTYSTRKEAYLKE